MNEDVRTSLSKFTVEELEAKKILIAFGDQYLLRAASVAPLIELMKDHQISGLEYPQRDWWLDSEFQFSNSASNEHTTGDARNLANPGNVFNERNKDINPFFRSIELQGSPEAAAGIAFGFERDLQLALRQNIEQLEPG